MSPSPPPGIANFDSASAMLRALAHFLHGKDFPGLGQPRLLQYPASLADWLPRWLRQEVFARVGASEGVPAHAAGQVSTAAIAEWFASLYPQRPYPAVAIGSSNGALVHLCAALGIPWLPQTLLTLIRHDGQVHQDDAAAAMVWARPAARAFLAANPGIALHHMHDPAQDRLMLAYIAYFRSKYLRLPQAYRAFIGRWLAPGGIILVSECPRRWPTSRLGDRYTFQFGALGGPSEHEYFHGGERVEAYLRRYRSPWQQWKPPPADGRDPEAEWGFEPALGEDIAALAREHGYRILRLIFDDPDDLGPPVADFHRAWYRQPRRGVERLLIGSFILVEPYWTLRLRAVPLWLKFPVEPSLRLARRYLARAETFDEVHLMLFAHGVESVGLPPIRAWQDLLRQARRGGSLLGVNPRAYPAHFGVYGRYQRALRRIAERRPLPPPISLEGFEQFLAASDASYAVRLEPPLAAHEDLP
jgi:hypothetical protein